MRYRYKPNGAVFDSPCDITGYDWEIVTPEEVDELEAGIIESDVEDPEEETVESEEETVEQPSLKSQRGRKKNSAK